MLNCMLKEGNGVIEIRGSVPEICLNISTIVKKTYESILEHDKAEAEAFKKFCNDLLPILPFVDDEEAEKVLEENIKKVADDNSDFKKRIDDLSELLDHVKEILK